MLLAIDTSTAQIGLALYDGAAVPGELLWHSRQHHTRQLAPALATLLERTGISMDSLQAVGVARGPGSFTSLRVGLAFAHGLALGRHIPLIGVPTLDIIAACVPVIKVKLVAVLQAGRGRLAVGWYQPSSAGWQPAGEPESMSAEDLEQEIHSDVIICGELTASDRQTLARKYRKVTIASPAQCVRRPAVLAEIAWKRWQAGMEEADENLTPIYLYAEGIPRV